MIKNLGNSECYDEQNFPETKYQFFRKMSTTPETFQRVNNQSEKTNLTTLVITGAILTTFSVGRLIIGNYVFTKIIPEVYKALQIGK